MWQLLLTKVVLLLIFILNKENCSTASINKSDNSPIVFVDETHSNVCNMSSGLPGICVKIMDCPNSAKEITNGFRPKICTFEGDTPVICCPKKPEFVFDEDACAATKPDDIAVEFVRAKLGNDAKSSAWPWTVAIFLKLNLMRSSPLCGGSLITEDVILTAAQCFTKFDRASYLVAIAGIDTIDRDATGSVRRIEMEVAEIIVHENYKFPMIYDDIALLKLKGRIEFSGEIRPICLPGKHWQQDSFEAVLAIITGTGGVQNATTRTTPMVLPNDGCNNVLQNDSSVKEKLPEGVTKTLICTGGPPQESNLCIGSIGSSLATEDSSVSKYVIIGIQTFQADCQKGTPGLGTRITEYIDWITAKLSTLT